ncbi:VOC family protein [Embleya sp. NPDC050154]|uniref:VOC family protein n=1 Tax=unclassified Embleya TaxID=2699296 RepID=UPI0037898A8D
MSHDRKQEQREQRRQEHEQDRDRLPVNTVLLNHTAVYAKDRQQAAEFLASILGLEVGPPLGPFLPVDLGNGVTLDYYEKNDEPIQSQHYAFLVPDDRFDAMIARLEALGVTYYADPSHSRADETNDWFGGRGAYFEDPNGHNMEIMTRPYARP